MAHTEFKTQYNSTNNDLNYIDPQLLTSWIKVPNNESHPSFFLPVCAAP